jgi:hypothetical protein
MLQVSVYSVTRIICNHLRQKYFTIHELQNKNYGVPFLFVAKIDVSLHPNAAIAENRWWGTFQNARNMKGFVSCQMIAQRIFSLLITATFL